MTLSRRTVLAGGTAAIAGLAAPALALTPEFLSKRGDLRIGLLADYPPFVFTRSGIPDTGILPSIGKVMANELWLSPSYVVIKPQSLEEMSYQEQFQRFGGLDMILHAQYDDVERLGLLHSSAYMTDQICFITLPDIREIGLFPRTFHRKKVIAFPDQMVREFMMNSPDSGKVNIDYNVTPDDLLNRIPIARMLNGEFEKFVATRRQLEWMLGISAHKFHINNIFFPDQNTRKDFCILVNPQSPWILEAVQKKITAMQKNYQLQNIYQKYDLI